jgi:hypothetical protein
MAISGGGWLVLVVLFGFTPALPSAQVNPAGGGILRAIGVPGGLTAAALQAGGAGGLSSTPGFLAGMFFTPRPDTLTWQIGALLHRKGGRIDDATVRGTYVEIPLMLHVNLRPDRKNRFHLLAGPSLAVRLTTTFRTDTETLDVSGGTAMLDVGAVVGGGMDIGRVAVGVRFMQGLMPIGITVEGHATRNRVVALVLGFRIGWRFGRTVGTASN